MKKQLVIYAVTVALAFGFTSTAVATSYTVKKGDSLYLIAQRHNVPLKTVIALNSGIVNPNLIYPNQIIQLPDNPQTNSSIKGDTTQQQILQLVNAERNKQGLKSLTLSSKLSDVANVKAKDMAVNHYFAHNSPTYGTPFEMIKSFGIKYRTAGENIAAGQKTPQEAMTSWMNSTGHRANILNANYTELGVGYYTGGTYGVYWVQQFIGN